MNKLGFKTTFQKIGKGLETFADQNKVFTYLLIIASFFYIILWEPLKPTNPSNPLFNEKLFELNDYWFQPLKLSDALSKLLPKGTPVERVDLILVERGGAGKGAPSPKEKDPFYVYSYKPFYLDLMGDAWGFRVYYDEQNRVKKIGFGGSEIVK